MLKENISIVAVTQPKGRVVFEFLDLFHQLFVFYAYYKERLTVEVKVITWSRVKKVDTYKWTVLQSVTI